MRKCEIQFSLAAREIPTRAYIPLSHSGAFSPIWSSRNLFDWQSSVGEFDDAETRYAVGTIALALEHLHARGWAHRDLKPENIMLGGRGELKLIDFGLCKRVRWRGEDLRAYTICGTAEHTHRIELGAQRAPSREAQARTRLAFVVGIWRPRCSG